MTVISVGEPELASVDIQFEQPVQPTWVYGHFRMRVGDDVIGNWDDIVTLVAVVGWWESLSQMSQQRWDPLLDGLDPVEMFHLIYEDEGSPPPLGWDAPGRFQIERLGMSSFDRFDVALVEPPGAEGQLLLWRSGSRDSEPSAKWLPAGYLQQLGTQLSNAYSAALKSEMRGVEPG